MVGPSGGAVSDTSPKFGVVEELHRGPSHFHLLMNILLVVGLARCAVPLWYMTMMPQQTVGLAVVDTVDTSHTPCVLLDLFMCNLCIHVSREVIPLYEPLVAYSLLACVVSLSCRTFVGAVSLFAPVVEVVDTECKHRSLIDMFFGLVRAVTTREAISLYKPLVAHSPLAGDFSSCSRCFATESTRLHLSDRLLYFGQFLHELLSFKYRRYIADFLTITDVKTGCVQRTVEGLLSIAVPACVMREVISLCVPLIAAPDSVLAAFLQHNAVAPSRSYVPSQAASFVG